MESELRNVLENLYILIRDEGYSSQSKLILNLIFYLDHEKIKEFQRTFKSSTIWGGAGSISDIDLRDRNKQTVLTQHLDQLKILGKHI